MNTVSQLQLYSEVNLLVVREIFLEAEQEVQLMVSLIHAPGWSSLVLHLSFVCEQPHPRWILHHNFQCQLYSEVDLVVVREIFLEAEQGSPVNCIHASGQSSLILHYFFVCEQPHPGIDLILCTLSCLLLTCGNAQPNTFFFESCHVTGLCSLQLLYTCWAGCWYLILILHKIC